MLCRDRIKQLLISTFKPIYIEVIDESINHHVPKGAETHMKLVLVSTEFEQLTSVKRHRLLYQALDGELKSGLHALTMHLYTPKEWMLKNEHAPDSPKCRDGYKHNTD